MNHDIKLGLVQRIHELEAALAYEVRAYEEIKAQLATSSYRIDLFQTEKEILEKALEASQ